MALGAAGETSPQPKSVLPWALGRESPEDGARTRLQCGTMLGEGGAAPDP